MTATRQHRGGQNAQNIEVAPPTGADVLDIEMYMMIDGGVDHVVAVILSRPRDRDMLLDHLVECADNSMMVAVLAGLEKADKATVAAERPPAAERQGKFDGMTAETLAALVRASPGDKQLIEDAKAALGADLVAQALALIEPAVLEAAPVVPVEVEQVAPVAETEVEPTPPEVVAAQAEAVAPDPEPVAKKAGKRKSSHAAKPDEKEEPSWVTGARRYNSAHQDYVVEFYANTGGETGDPLTGEPDPYQVARWQKNAGLSPDGRIGPDTVEFSRIEMEEVLPNATALPDNVA